MPRYAELMRHCDKVDHPNFAILIVWNEQDEETFTSKKRLDQAVQKAFVSKSKNTPSNFYRDGATSLDEFKQILSKALVRAQNNVIELLGQVRAIRGEGPASIPAISAAKQR